MEDKINKLRQLIIIGRHAFRFVKVTLRCIYFQNKMYNWFFKNLELRCCGRSGIGLSDEALEAGDWQPASPV